MKVRFTTNANNFYIKIATHAPNWALFTHTIIIIVPPFTFNTKSILLHSEISAILIYIFTYSIFQRDTLIFKEIKKIALVALKTSIFTIIKITIIDIGVYFKANSNQVWIITGLAYFAIIKNVIWRLIAIFRIIKNTVNDAILRIKNIGTHACITRKTSIYICICETILSNYSNTFIDTEFDIILFALKTLIFLCPNRAIFYLKVSYTLSLK